MEFHTRAALLLVTLVGVHALDVNPVYKSSVSVKGAAVAALAPDYPGSNGPSLLVSTFGVSLVGGNPTYVIKDLPNAVSGNASTATVIESSEHWSNFIGPAPAELGHGLVLVAGGFLVPVGGISTGTVCIFDVSDPNEVIRTQISTDKKGWFYHKVVWYDMNGDGRLDLVAARATAPSNPAGEMVWFEQPSSGALSNSSYKASAWQEHVVVPGPDVDFIFEDLDGDGKPELVACQFFSAPILAIYSCPESSWSLCNQSNVVKTVIDDKNGPFFAAEHVDLNGDGKFDLLVTNNQDGKAGDGPGSVFAYEQPPDISGTWTIHVLSTGYIPNPTTLPSPGAHSRGSPGRASSFKAQMKSSGKPQILLSGDDAGTISVLSPVSEDTSSWEYSQMWISNSTGTVGTPAIGDIDNDGLADVFIPNYSANRVDVYSFAEAPAPTPPSAECTACLLKKDPVKLSAAYAWCYKDNQCYLVGNPTNPCAASQCTSEAHSSSCSCTSCNDAACR